MNDKPTLIDHSALRFNQACIIFFLALAFVLDQPWLVAFVAAVMAVGTLLPQAGLFKLVYRKVLQPLGLIHPSPVPDDPRPHLFAQGVGALCLVLATIALAAGLPLPGWGLVAFVAALAAINLFLGFCLGCFVYYQLARRGIYLNLPWWQAAQGA
jgi:hypothetical protein